MPYFNINLNLQTILVMLVATIISVAIFVLLYRKQKNRKILLALFSLYLFGLIVITSILNPSSSTVQPPPLERVNMTPFINLFYTLTFNIPYVFIQLLLNILLFMPMGILLPMILPHFNSYKKIFLIALGTSLIIEISQWSLPASNRIFDVDDIICNVVGAIVGFSLWKLFYLIQARQNKAKSAFVAPIIICVVFVLFAIRPILPPGRYSLVMIDSPHLTPQNIQLDETLNNLGKQSATVFRMKANKQESIMDEVGEHGLLDLDSAALSNRELIDPVKEVSTISLKSAVQRGLHGVARDIYTSGIAKPNCVQIKSAEIKYTTNSTYDYLVPVWFLTGEVTSYDKDKDPFLTERGSLRVNLVIPALPCNI